MFALDEALKPHLLAKLSSDGFAHKLLDNYWDQLVLYMLTGPLQYMHLAHLLRATDWDHYGFVGKMFTFIYALLCLVIWEALRILAYHLFNSDEDMKQVASRVLSSAQDLAKKGYERAKPMLESLSKQANVMLENTVAKAQHTASQMLGSNAVFKTANAIERASQSVRGSKDEKSAYSTKSTGLQSLPLSDGNYQPSGQSSTQSSGHHENHNGSNYGTSSGGHHPSQNEIHQSSYYGSQHSGQAGQPSDGNQVSQPSGQYGTGSHAGGHNGATSEAEQYYGSSTAPSHSANEVYEPSRSRANSTDDHPPPSSEGGQ